MWGFIGAIALFCVLLTIAIKFINPKVRKELSIQKTILLTIAFVLLLLCGWWAVTHGEKIEDRVLAPIILPSISEVLQSFPRLHMEQGLTLSIIASFRRVTIGFALASVLAFTLGVFMAAYSPVAAFFRPVALIGSYVPIISFIPLTLAWWGVGEVQKIGFLFIACFVVLLPLVIKSIDKVNNAYLDVAKTKGASQWQLVWDVLVPIAMPDIWDHMRGIYGVGWGWIILAEVVNAQNGIGYLMSISERRGQTSSIFALIIIIVIIASICDKLWKVAGQKLFRRSSQ